MRLEKEREVSPSEAIFGFTKREERLRVSEAVGYEAAKVIKGCERHLTIDNLGKAGNKSSSFVKRMGEIVSHLHAIWVNGGNDGNPFLR